MNKLPTGWFESSLGEIAETQLGKMLNRGNQSGVASRPYLRNLNVQWGRVDLTDVKEMDIFPEEWPKFSALPGDLLVCEGGESGRAAIWQGSEPIGIQNAIHRVRPKSFLDSKFLLYNFEWQVKEGRLNHLFSGVTIKHFTQEKLRRMKVAYPSLEEQHQIVELLEEHLSRLDAAMKYLELTSKEATKFRRSLLQRSFQITKTNGLSTVDWVSLKSVALVRGGNTPKGLLAVISDVKTEVKKIPFFKVAEMNLHPKYLSVARGYISDSDINTLKIIPTAPGSLVFPKAGGAIGTNKKRVVEMEGAIDTNCMSVTPHETLASEYLYWFFESLTLSDISNGSILPQISKKTVEELLIPVPGLEVQREIVKTLEENLSVIESFLNEVHKQNNRIQSLRRSILNAAFTGQLTTEVAYV